MPLQKTFTLIPQALSPAGGSPTVVQRMTSKQARKAYKTSNRMPPMSRAERIKQERAEQERIRKEFEKEKAAAKAKAAREKKREKELAEKEEKRKKRLPLVTVRPSQDTIARFVRGNGSGKKRDSGGDNLNEGLKTLEAPILEPAIEEEDEDKEDTPQDSGESHARDEVLEPNALLQESPEKSETIATEMDIPEKEELDADVEDLEIMTDEKPLKEPPCDEEASSCGKKTPAIKENSTESGSFSDLNFMSREVDDCEQLLHGEIKTTNENQAVVQKEVSGQQNSQDIDLLPDEDVDDFELEMLALEATANPKPACEDSRITSSPPNEAEKRARKATVYETDLGLDEKVQKETSFTAKSATASQNMLMPPPPPPPPRRRSPSPPSPTLLPQQEPPPSTQAILFNFDDFFPTSSQQARELEEEPIQSTPQASEPTHTPPIEAQSQHTSPKQASPQQASSSPEEPKRFFTSSGTRERMAVALLQSRRTAEREERQRQEAMKQEALELERIRREEYERKARQERLAQHRKNAQIHRRAPYERSSGRQDSLMKVVKTAKQSEQTPSSREAYASKATPVGTNTESSAQPARRLKPNQVPVKETPLAKPVIYPRPAIQANKNLPPKQSNDKISLSAEINKDTSIREASKENIPPLGLSSGYCPSASQETEYGGDWVDEVAMELMI